MAKPILVLGGSGFVGRAIQQQVIVEGRTHEFVFAYRDGAARIDSRVKSLRVDLLDPDTLPVISEYDEAIWVAGSSDHGRAVRDPLGDLECSVVTMLRFLGVFRGNLTMLSSQAVYFGLKGEIREDVDHATSMPYGFAKLAAERYAAWALQAGQLTRLWIHRLMYAYGSHENPRRLLSRCLAAAETGEDVLITGGGRSFLNPLPVGFVAEVLLRSSEHLPGMSPGSCLVTNLNHPECWTVLDVVEFIVRLRRFSYEVTGSGEEWPVEFFGCVDRLIDFLAQWGLAFPSVEASLESYVMSESGRL